MKKLILILSFLSAYVVLFAQTEKKEIVLEPLPITTKSPWITGTGKVYYNGGKVGIGTASPAQKLQVEGNLRLLNSGGYIQKVKGLYFTWASSYGTQFNHGIFSTDGTSYSDDITLNSYGNVRINFDSNSNGTNKLTIGHHTTGLSNTLLTIDESGNVGIGMTPVHRGAKLEIKEGWGSWIQFFNKKNSGYWSFHNGESQTDFHIYYKRPDGSIIYPLRLKTDGSIETKELLVAEVQAGNIFSKELTLEVENVADYVFDENYSLNSLEEVERFVKENKHLPGIPSADVLEDKGVNVALMSNALLEKVEELTLYIIQLEKRISEIENK
jgi:hypothetical protein